jgi:hypothetical protein
VFFGPQGYQIVQEVYANRLKTWADWQGLSMEAHGKPRRVILDEERRRTWVSAGRCG